MSKPCNREACALRLERVAATAKLLAADLRKHCWYDDARISATQIYADATVVYEQVMDDKAWEAADR